MLFIIGISSKEKKLDFVQTMLCAQCEQFGRLEVFLTYTYLSLFFIPVLKWGKNYYVKSSCCNTIYQLSPALGKRILKGEVSSLSEQDLNIVQKGSIRPMEHPCDKCGYIVNQEFEYCPKCGEKL